MTSNLSWSSQSRKSQLWNRMWVTFDLFFCLLECIVISQLLSSWASSTWPPGHKLINFYSRSHFMAWSVKALYQCAFSLLLKYCIYCILFLARSKHKSSCSLYIQWRWKYLNILCNINLHCSQIEGQLAEGTSIVVLVCFTK